jgi:hypothetical protein
MRPRASADGQIPTVNDQLAERGTQHLHAHAHLHLRTLRTFRTFRTLRTFRTFPRFRPVKSRCRWC